MGQIYALTCATCGAVFTPYGNIQDFCPTCGQRFGTLECVMNLKHAAASFQELPLGVRLENTILRYEPLLPIKNRDNYPALKIGLTPTYSERHLAKFLSLREIFVKDDGLNPTASYKDRASAIVTTRCLELNYPAVCCASTGNAAASLAACSTVSGIPCIVFVPKNIPPAKLTQIVAYGARVVGVDGTYDQAYDLAQEACKKYGWFNRSAGLNPYLVEGKKTGAFELCEALNYEVPDAVFVGAGDGSIILGICKGFQEFKHLGFISRIPRVYGVQAEGASVLKDTYDEYLRKGCVLIKERSVETIADSICVGNPREGVRALKAVRITDGGFLSVSDEDIMSAVRFLAKYCGVFSEPAGAIGYAGLVKAQEEKQVDHSERVAVFVTGNGLKDIQAVQGAMNLDFPVIEPDVTALDSLNLSTFSRK